MHDGLHAALTERIIECSIEVHRNLGPGLLESIYESALCYELTVSGLAFKRQLGVALYYKGILLSEHRPDLVVADAVIVEVKAVDPIRPHSHGASADLSSCHWPSRRVDSELQ